MEIRELKARDVKTLAKMLGKLKPESIDGLLGLLAEKKADPKKVGLSLFHIIAADLTDDIYAWLADLIGKTTAELDEMPASAPVGIVKALTKGGDFKSFFDSAIQQAEKPSSSPDSTTLSSNDMDGMTK